MIFPHKSALGKGSVPLVNVAICYLSCIAPTVDTRIFLGLGFLFFRSDTSILNDEITGLSRTTKLHRSSQIKVHKTKVYSEMVNQHMQ